MKLRFIAPAILAVFLSLSVEAQEPASSVRVETGPQSVINGDRGRAFIIEGETQPVSNLENHGQVIAAPEQTSIFLGSGWETPTLRAREPELANLLTNITDQAHARALDQSGIKDFFAATSSQERLEDFGGRSISDLEIEGMLAAMIKEGSLHPPGVNTIYIVFLEPGMRSTLGTMIAGKHYVAYHNFFSATNMKVHYVVVPFVTNKKTAFRVALRAFLAAAVQPTVAGL